VTDVCGIIFGCVGLVIPLGVRARRFFFPEFSGRLLRFCNSDYVKRLNGGGLEVSAVTNDKGCNVIVAT
jgi:hypothetical protein